MRDQEGRVVAGAIAALLVAGSIVRARSWSEPPPLQRAGPRPQPSPRPCEKAAEEHFAASLELAEKTYIDAWECAIYGVRPGCNGRELEDFARRLVPGAHAVLRESLRHCPAHPSSARRNSCG
jgi:hypothetical protein